MYGIKYSVAYVHSTIIIDGLSTSLLKKHPEADFVVVQKSLLAQQEPNIIFFANKAQIKLLKIIPTLFIKCFFSGTQSKAEATTNELLQLV